MGFLARNSFFCRTQHSQMMCLPLLWGVVSQCARGSSHAGHLSFPVQKSAPSYTPEKGSENSTVGRYQEYYYYLPLADKEIPTSVACSTDLELGKSGYLLVWQVPLFPEAVPQLLSGGGSPPPHTDPFHPGLKWRRKWTLILMALFRKFPSSSEVTIYNELRLDWCVCLSPC